MNFAGIVKQSFIDYPGKITAVIFTRGCNLRCPFCHNGHLIIKPGKMQNDSVSEDEIIKFLRERKGFLDAVVISGGEPTLNSELPDFIRRVKELGILVKLDTNGTNPLMLEMLLSKNLIDYVAMDIKAPLNYEKYSRACGKITPELFLNIRNSVHLLRNCEIKVEFRTTVVPALHSRDDICEIAKQLEDTRLYSLQQFNPDFTLDNSFNQIIPYSQEEMEEMAQYCRKYIERVQVLNI